MKLIDYSLDFADHFLDKFRPERLVDEEQVKREAGYKDRSRVQWLLDHTYLTEGGLEDLKEVFETVRGEKAVHAYIDLVNRRVPRRVSVSTVSNNINMVKVGLEKMLKLALHERRSNSGIKYRVYEKGNIVVAEAIPAVVGR